MDKKLKLKIISALAILLAFACLISAGWVIAQSAQVASVNKQNAPKNNQLAQQTLQTPQNTRRFFGTIGRPDPFIPVKAVGGKAAQKTIGSSGQSGTSKMLSSEESQSGASLSGTFITNGSRYALIRLGDQNYIVKQGDIKLGFKVVRIASKSVTLTSKSGTINLKIEDYSSSNQAPAQAESLPGADTKSLVPPAMQAPVPAQTEANTNTDVKPAANVQPEKNTK